MTTCTHTLCGKQDRIWLPTTPDRYSSIEQHQWCTECGMVQNKSDDRPKKIGYWMNKLSTISYELSLPQVQKRLIAKEIEQNEYFHDNFSSYGSSQQELFIQIVNKYCDTSPLDFDEIFPVSLK